MASIDAPVPATTPAPASAGPGSRAAGGGAPQAGAPTSPGKQPGLDVGVWLVCSLGAVIWVGLLVICVLAAPVSSEQSSIRTARPHQEHEKSAPALEGSASTLLLCGRNAGRGHADRGRGVSRVGAQRVGTPAESAIAEVIWMRGGRSHFANASEERQPRKGALLKPPVLDPATAKGPRVPRRRDEGTVHREACRSDSCDPPCSRPRLQQEHAPIAEALLKTVHRLPWLRRSRNRKRNSSVAAIDHTCYW